jgi:hypothetical protein
MASINKTPNKPTTLPPSTLQSIDSSINYSSIIYFSELLSEQNPTKQTNLKPQTNKMSSIRSSFSSRLGDYLPILAKESKADKIERKAQRHEEIMEKGRRVIAARERQRAALSMRMEAQRNYSTSTSGSDRS